MDSANDVRSSSTVRALVRTILDAFEAAHDLHKRLKKKVESFERGEEDPQKRPLKSALKQRPREVSSGSESESGRGRLSEWRSRRSKSRSKSRTKPEDATRKDRSIKDLSMVVKAEFDRGVERFGEKFAVGDLAATSELQAQVIVIQDTMVMTYRDSSLLSNYSRYPLSYYVSKLLKTVETAEAISIDVLTSLYQRLSGYTLHHRIPGSYPLTSGSSHDSGSGIVTTSSTHSGRPEPHKVFCPYARDLQRNSSQPLADSYNPGGSNRCPFCAEHTGIAPGRAWEVVLEDPEYKNKVCVFLIGRRFMVKCHREGGGFACVLCATHRRYDTVCARIDELVDHIWKDHDVLELGDEIKEGDIFEIA